MVNTAYPFERKRRIGLPTDAVLMSIVKDRSLLDRVKPPPLDYEKAVEEVFILYVKCYTMVAVNEKALHRYLCLDEH